MCGSLKWVRGGRGPAGGRTEAPLCHTPAHTDAHLNPKPYLMSRMTSGGRSSVFRMPRSVTKGETRSWMERLVRGAKSMAD